MIQSFASRYQKRIACLLFAVFYASLVLPLRVSAAYRIPALPVHQNSAEFIHHGIQEPTNEISSKYVPSGEPQMVGGPEPSIAQAEIDGPGQPEMATFKSAGTNNMVSLFTGDFSYNIPLLDVGGYPVNIYYNGGITMEQEASWVGLGWNINPGNINRNMRGIPDDFNGEEVRTQSQNMKKNITWGASLGAGLEVVGINQFSAFSGSIGASLGMSVNNYLGPSIELGIQGQTGLNLGKGASSEKATIGLSMGLSANLSSRSGLTFAPNLSLSAKSFMKESTLSLGVGASTSYNSRSGIKGLQLNEQMSFSYTQKKDISEKSSQTSKFLKNDGSVGINIFSSSISFTKPSYSPAIRPIITNSSGAGKFKLGGAMMGIYPNFEVEGYAQVSEILPSDRVQQKPMVGFMYAEKAKGNRDALMDFTRFNDKEVTASTTIISVPQYAYDIFSIQGEGTGGTIRAYRNDMGYVRDNYTNSRDKSWSAGVDVGFPGHVGANFNTVRTPSVIGEWENENKLKDKLGFGTASGLHENVYFRNPGESSVIHPDQYQKIGGTDLVRYKLNGDELSPGIETKLQKFSSTGAPNGEVDILTAAESPDRVKRTQVISFLTAEEADIIGLDKKIKYYESDPGLLLQNNLLKVKDEFDRYDAGSGGFRRPHHISQINVTEADGRRYVYGLPVYNTKQIDYTFTVSNDCNDCDQVPFTTNVDISLTSSHITGGIGSKDGYTQINDIPGYAHSFLLSGLLSPDYVDINGDGITEDDQGTAIKFNYTYTGIHKWRTPLSASPMANSNPGNLSEKRDDKGLVSYGERESWYLHSIESKTMIAFFVLEDRKDGKGATNEFSGVDGGDHSIKRLRQIDLYNKADLKNNGLTGSKPVKTVHFEYSYSLCANTPDNTEAGSTDKGKLTLEKIWFTYNGVQNRSAKNQYVFSYSSSAGQAAAENPSYPLASYESMSDRWGNYKNPADNPEGMKNRDYPFVVQDKTKADLNAAAWALKKILLPSGGQIEVQYESDDYAFVQNKRAAVMSEILGFSDKPTAPSSKLYSVSMYIYPVVHSSIVEHDYMFIKVSEACATRSDVYEKYLRGITQLAVKMRVSMPKGYEYLTSYAEFEDYGVYTDAGVPAIWVKLKKTNENSPLSQTALEFLREQLPGQAFPGYDVSEGTPLDQISDMLGGWLDAVASAFSDIPKYLRSKGLAQEVDLTRSFVRIADPDGFKYGGGHRVKKLILKDNWDKMTNQYGSEYGQEYDYTTTEIFNGVQRTISSGVASYEPTIGGEENPFQNMIQFADKVPLGPTSYGAIEMPVLDAFFPAPLVGYSKVTVRSLKKGPSNLTRKSGIGKQVSEFYTARDFPVQYSHTKLDPESDLQLNENPVVSFFYSYAFDSRAISQGFLVATNDMHGQPKSQSSYAENDPDTRINYTEYFYRNTGTKGMDEKFDFLHVNKTESGIIREGNMGIDIELMTDTREFLVKTKSIAVQGQVDWLIVGLPFTWFPFVWGVYGETENAYRAVTCTKLINYHSVVDKVIVMDKGSQVTTENLVYDSETGQVLISKANNEFEKPIYSVNFPAYWGYSGMGLAYKNIDAIFTDVNFLDGRIVSGIPANELKDIFESGDELYVFYPGDDAACDPVMTSPNDNRLIWAVDMDKNSGSLTNTEPDLIFMDAEGKPYSRSHVNFRIVRSGKRNMLGTPAAGVTLMTDPVITESGIRKLRIDNNSQVVSASAVEYKEKWQVDNGVIEKFTLEIDPVTCVRTEVTDCEGYLDKNINPYRKGLLGNFRANRSLVFYGSRTETDPESTTNLPQNGFLADFGLYWNFNVANNLVPDAANTKWVWNNEVTRINAKGLELETKDALQIYTGAQYGYSKTLPLAIAGNSRNYEMFFEGFEDYSYDDRLNAGASNICEQRHIDFNNLEGSDIISNISFNAHTGKSVLQLDANQTVQKALNVIASAPETFPIQYELTSVKQLVNTGGLYAKISTSTPANAPVAAPTMTVANLGMNLNFGPNTVNGEIVGNTVKYEHHHKTTQYTKVTIPGTYAFTLSTSQSEVPLGETPQYVYNTSHIFLTIKNLDNQTIASFSSNSGNSPQNFNVFLTCDTYLIECICDVDIQKTYQSPYSTFRNFSAQFSYSSNLGTTSYKNLVEVENCSYTKPLAANSDMIHPVFSLQQGKKMLFSGWVRETCTGTCPGYTNSRAELLFNDGSSTLFQLNPSGPVIEGWQRVEGVFTVPASATSVTLKLVNNSGAAAYWDDIRIHPFNANLKGYVYDPVNLRLLSQLDENNYAVFYEYDEEGTLIRTKAETREGIKTISESRSARQKTITTIQ